MPLSILLEGEEEGEESKSIQEVKKNFCFYS